MNKIKLLLLGSTIALSGCESKFEKALKCGKDAQCFYDEMQPIAITSCRSDIKDHLRNNYPYDFDFDDGLANFFDNGNFVDSKFIYTGNKLKIKNAFGSFARHRYYCRFDIQSLENYKTIDFEIERQ